MSADAFSAGPIVVDDVWGKFDHRAATLREESRKHLDRRRRRALWYDGLLLAPVSITCVVVAGGAWDLLAAAFALSYFFVCETLTGQTWGKRKMGLRVVRLDGRPLTIAACAARNVVLPIDALGCYLVGYMVMLASGGRRQRIGDFVAGTVVTEADGHAHVSAPERARNVLLVGYPLVWITTATVVVTLIGPSDAGASAYAAQVSQLCQSARATVGPGAGVDTLQQAGMVAAQLQRELAAMTPPASMREAHARLVSAQERMSGELIVASSELSSSAHPRATAARLQAEFDAHRAADAQALAGLGLDACL